MLRRYTTARFARTHSPFREQRLVLFAKKDDDQLTHGQIEQAPNHRPQDEGRGILNPVEAIKTSIQLDVAAATPDQILERMNKPVFFDMLTTTGALDTRLKKTAKDMNVEIDTATADEKGRISEKLLKDSTEAELIRAAQATAADLERHEELLRNPEQNLRRIEKLGADPKALNQALEQIKTYTNKNDGQGLKQALEEEYITESNVTRILGIKGTYSQNDRKNILGVLRDIDRDNRIRTAYGQVPGTVETDSEKLRANRENFINGLKANLQTLVEFIEAKLRNKLKTLENRNDDISIHFDGETLDRFGITVDGIGDALYATDTSLKSCRSKLGSSKTGIDQQSLLKLSSVTDELDRLDLELSPANGSELPRMLESAKNFEESLEEIWAPDAARSVAAINIAEVKAVSPKGAAYLRELQRYFEPFMPGNTPSLDERIAIRQTTHAEQVRMSNAINILAFNPVGFNEGIETSQEPITTIINSVRNKIAVVIPDLLGKIDHPVAKALNLRIAIKERQTEISAMLQTAEEWSDTSASGTQKKMQAAHGAKAELARLEKCSEWLTQIQRRDGNVITEINDPQEYRRIAKADSFGCYSYDDGKIYLNMDKITNDPNHQNQRQRTVEHEIGHAITDAFRRFNVFPTLLLDIHNRLTTKQSQNGRPFTELLTAQAPAWKIPVQDSSHPTNEETWKLMDELTNRYAEWKSEGEPLIQGDKAELFRLFENDEIPTRIAPLKMTGTIQDAPDAEEPPEPGSPAAAGEGQKDFADSLLEKAEKLILDCDAFLEAYPNLSSQAEEEYHFSDNKAKVIKLRAKFKSGAYRNDASFNATVKAIIEHDLKPFIEAIEAYDLQKNDLTGVDKTGSRTLSTILFWEVEWLSIGDMIALFKETGEDIQRMWKRRGEGARARVGKSLTSLIPDDIIYLGRLKHDFERRERESEEAEVSVWEKGWEKIDEHDLQHIHLPKVTSTDQLKAIINLLTHHGRLEWDDHRGLWTKLEQFSGYRMPRAACLRDTRLRNSWLQKMIATIWRNKDLYEKWKTENDGAIKSGTDKFTNYADDISALGLHTKELGRLLKNWEKVHLGTASKEEEVNPHLYEKILFHAMFNGKSSMEAKFFYLIKGVQTGLLSIDRLRAFSGEKFGILNQFPFIDFFSTGQNNTMHEVRKMAAKVTENGDHRFSPGARMTKFLYDTVAFDKNVKDRVQKALKRGENIDHEDIPMAITQMTANEVSQFINFTSGSQAKSSAPALKNGYVGYTSFLKYFAIKSKIGHPPLTDRDTAKLVETLGAYMLWDNTITRYSLAAVTDQKPMLGWDQINNEVPVSGEHMTCEYRDAMNEFTLKLSQKMGLTEVDGIDIEDFVGKGRSAETKKFLVQKYCVDTDAAGKPRLSNEREIFERIQRGTDEFMNKLRNGIKKDPSILKTILEASETSFIAEQKEKFTEQNVRKIWNNGNGGSSRAAIDHALAA